MSGDWWLYLMVEVWFAMMYILSARATRCEIGDSGEVRQAWIELKRRRIEAGCDQRSLESKDEEEKGKYESRERERGSRKGLHCCAKRVLRGPRAEEAGWTYGEREEWMNEWPSPVHLAWGNLTKAWHVVLQGPEFSSNLRKRCNDRQLDR
jgi:hypothetical protein